MAFKHILEAMRLNMDVNYPSKPVLPNELVDFHWSEGLSYLFKKLILFVGIHSLCERLNWGMNDHPYVTVTIKGNSYV